MDRGSVRYIGNRSGTAPRSTEGNPEFRQRSSGVHAPVKCIALRVPRAPTLFAERCRGAGVFAPQPTGAARRSSRLPACQGFDTGAVERPDASYLPGSTPLSEPGFSSLWPRRARHSCAWSRAPPRAALETVPFAQRPYGTNRSGFTVSAARRPIGSSLPSLATPRREGALNVNRCWSRCVSRCK